MEREGELEVFLKGETFAPKFKFPRLQSIRFTKFLKLLTMMLVRSSCLREQPNLSNNPNETFNFLSESYLPIENEVDPVALSHLSD